MDRVLPGGRSARNLHTAGETHTPSFRTMTAMPIAPVPPAATPTPSPGPASNSARRVLVVEDEPSIAEAVAARLRSEGFSVEIALDGPAGVAACERARPDLVVLDLM